MIQQAEMHAALKRIRMYESEARRATDRCDNNACYTALENCQHAAFDAKALFHGVKHSVPPQYRI